MLAIVKRPGEPAERVQLPENHRTQLRAMQALVGGYIEIGLRGRDFVVWCDEEGMIKRPPPAFNFYRVTDAHPIVGSVLVTALVPSEDGMICAPLTDEQAMRIAMLLDLWATRSIYNTGASVEDFDPADERDAAAIRLALRGRGLVATSPEVRELLAAGEWDEETPHRGVDVTGEED